MADDTRTIYYCPGDNFVYITHATAPNDYDLFYNTDTDMEAHSYIGHAGITRTDAAGTYQYDFRQCQGSPCGSPIIVDTNDVGFVDTLTSSEDGEWFDFNNTGHKVHMAWLRKGSGLMFLVSDVDHDGLI